MKKKIDWTQNLETGTWQVQRLALQCEGKSRLTDSAGGLLRHNAVLKRGASGFKASTKS